MLVPVDTSPLSATFSPLDEATDALIGSDIILYFNKTIKRGTGNIVLKTSSDTVIATYDAASSTNLSISGSTLTINPTADLVYSTGYKVEFASGSIKDIAGNNYAGTTSYNFATAAKVLPVATAASVTTDEDMAKSGILTGTDVNGSALSFSKVADPSHGTVTINATTGAYTYTPVANYNGSDSFTFKVNDGTLDSAFATVSLTVNAVNDAPTGSVTVSGIANQGQTLTATNSLADVDGLGAVSYQWKAGGTAIAGATNSTLSLGQAEVGKAIAVVASYTDGFGQVESVISIATELIRAATSSSLTGHVYDWKTHTLLSDVDVKLTAQNSATNLASKSGVEGTFGFESLDAGTYQLDFSKALTTAETGSAINSADALAALKIAVGRNPNADPDGDGPLTAPPVSPYQFIAADANQDGKITSADALAILKMAVKRTDAPAREWLFVNENQDFWNEATSSLPGSFTTTKSSVLWDKVLQVSSPLTTQQNVVAVLKGDVNGSWTAPAGSQDLDITTPSYFNDLAAKLGTQASQWAVMG